MPVPWNTPPVPKARPITNTPTAPQRDERDPRTIPGTIITNGHRMWELREPTDQVDGFPAVNIDTGYPIVLNQDTIESCWVVPIDGDYDRLLAA